MRLRGGRQQIFDKSQLHGSFLHIDPEFPHAAVEPGALLQSSVTEMTTPLIIFIMLLSIPT